MLQRTSRSTLSQGIVQQLLGLIERHEITPGDKLPTERELMEQLGVSRNCVREAMQSLAAMKLIDIKPGRGAVVLPPTPEFLVNPHALSSMLMYETLQELFEFRLILEVAIAGLAAEKATEDDLRLLDETFAQLEAAHRQSLPAYHAADLSFHNTLALLSHNRPALRVLTAIAGLLIESRKATASVPGAMAKALSHHRAIYERVSARDVEGAKRAMETHLRDVYRDLADYWENVRGNGAQTRQ